jgi:tripartite-type tricarboxylate transporter receptor subunit TctC
MPLLRFFLSIVSIITILNAGTTFAQPSANRPIRMVTSAPGGTSDVVGRLLAQGLASTTGRLAIVDNRGGGMIPPTIVFQSAPDGNTLLLYSGTLWIAPLLEKTPYDAVKDFAPVTLAVVSPNVLVIHPSLAANSVAELIALAKAKPGAINYGSGGTGASTHLAGELFNAMAGVKITRIPYKATGPALNDLIGGQLQVMFPTAVAGLPHVKSGRLRALAVTTSKPSALAPGLPTVAASGLSGYESVSLVGIFSKAGIPQPILNRLNQDLVRALNLPDIKEKLFISGLEVVANSPAEFLTVIKSDITRLSKVIRDAGIKAE